MKYLTIKEAAATLSLSEKAVRQRICRGQIPHRKLGKRVLISADELEKFLEGLPGRTVKDAIGAVEAAQ